MTADQSDKWHHSMCRYLGLDSDNDFLFGIMPGVCREVVGRRDFMYTNPECFNSKLVYSFTEYHHRKINKSKFVKSYYGTMPFMWDLGLIALSKQYKPEGSLFFLPRDDQVTIREDEYKLVQEWIDWAPRPITFLLPWRECDIWRNWEKLTLPIDSLVVQMKDRVNRQFILSDLFLRHEHVYIPWPGTDVYYAEFLEKNIHIYDSIKRYRTKTADEAERANNKVIRFLKWGYDYLNDTQKEFFHWTEKWNDIDVNDRRFLTTKVLGLDALKSPEQLREDMIEQGFLQSDLEFYSTGMYQQSYEWLKKKTEKIVNSNCSSRCTTLYDKL